MITSAFPAELLGDDDPAPVVDGNLWFGAFNAIVPSALIWGAILWALGVL